MMRKILFFVLFATSMLTVPAAFKRVTHGFHPVQFVLSFPFHYHWEAVPNEEIRTVLRQRFTFLSKGAQSYVFESEDGKYVIKLFRYDRRCTRSKLRLLFHACELAYRRARNETGVVYVHCNPTPMDLPVLRCKGPMGQRLEFPLDNMRFALQKKAQGFEETLLQARHSPDEMRKRITQFLDLLQARSKRQIFNADPSLTRNFGFLDNLAVEIDFGNFRIAEKDLAHQEVARFGQKLHKWLEKRMPEWTAFLDEELEKRIREC